MACLILILAALVGTTSLAREIVGPEDSKPVAEIRLVTEFLRL